MTLLEHDTTHCHDCRLCRAAARIAALETALRDVLDCVWSGSSADRKFWRDEAVATFERAAALAQADTAPKPYEFDLNAKHLHGSHERPASCRGGARA